MKIKREKCFTFCVVFAFFLFSFHDKYYHAFNVLCKHKVTKFEGVVLVTYFGLRMQYNYIHLLTVLYYIFANVIKLKLYLKILLNNKFVCKITKYDFNRVW